MQSAISGKNREALMEYRIRPLEMKDDAGITVVGCGGTGGFVAEGICRLLGDREHSLLLIDHDRVEPHNLRRQAFYEHDLGKFKSQALAERLCRLYGRRIMYSVYPFTPDTIDDIFKNRGYTRRHRGLVIGCVDNAPARSAIQEAMGGFSWWIDAGNGEHSGQVLIGNVSEPVELTGGFDCSAGKVDRLPLPTVQEPALLIPPTEPVVQDMDCAEAVEANLQSPVVNQAMATLVLQFVSKLLEGTLTWMGLYVDLGAGTLHPIPAEPKTVARLVGVKVDQLIAKDKEPKSGNRDERLSDLNDLAPYCPRCGRRHW